MQNRWDDADARELVEHFAELEEAFALRIYTSRLIGGESALVLHGGGNTSFKSRAVDVFGEPFDVLYVKGSGHDLEQIGPEGFPGVRLASLVRLRELEALDDKAMNAEANRARLDPEGPTPSVELLLHAFLPHRYVDHSHADAILALTNQPDGEARVRALYGDRIGWVPYTMPGFELAKRASEVFEKNPDCEGLVLERHGLFSFGDDARQSYERHVAIADAAECHILEQVEGRRILDARPVLAMREAAEVVPLLRGALATATGDSDRPFQPCVIEHRASDEIHHFAASEMAAALCAQPPITPDHALRTKGPYLLVERPPYANEEALAATLRAEVERYRHEYRQYFERNRSRAGAGIEMIDPTPRVVVLPGLGVFATGQTRRAARVAADIAEHTIRAKIWASTIGLYAGISDEELFDMEYWPPERAKLDAATPPPMAGRVALITGGAGAIGEGIARVLLDAGACVALIDHDEERLEAARARLDSDSCEGVAVDVTDEIAVRDGFRFAAEQFGGVDLIVPNAGVAVTGSLETLDPDEFQRAIDVNLGGVFLTLREGLRMLRSQAIGGDVVLISTKNVTSPGAEFGAYSASKAGGHQLGRVAALEAAPIGVRVNMVNADAVFGSEENPSGLWESVGPARAEARGIEPSELAAYYRDRNLLKAPVTAEHVGRAVLFFATRQTPTTGAAIPVDGGLPDATPR
jgi:rhamnulose-1-phosphate aldolase/alcohol dehydrogenase